MSTSLSRELRSLLERTTSEARRLAESACRAALENVAVHEREYRSHMNVEQRTLRNRLRARGRAIGDKRDERTGIQEIGHLTELAAYEHWHRLLFTRFLTENNLLITDPANGSVPVTLDECNELAPELGARDGFDLACRFSSLTLPGVFRNNDPVLDLPIALNDQVELRKLLAALPAEVFRADDALGWTYQFWQAQRKAEINKSGRKIGADELAPVTQLFTEDYMVEFLLHNTIGAWWAGKLGPIKADTEEEARARAGFSARDGVPGITWTYLRFVQDEMKKTWAPAAGTFEGWPRTANLIRLLDPCMGSGHFLVFALPLLVRLRIEEEGLSVQAAVRAVLKDNLHGLELDDRCTQIAAFNLALSAWKLGGYQMLPGLNLACSGLAPNATESEWVALAGSSERGRRGMAQLHGLFKDAPVLGSLINPRAQSGDMFEAEFSELAPLLSRALARETKDATVHELAVIAQGLAKAAELLAGQFTLVITNVPYLGRGKQDEVLKDYCERVHPEAKPDLATCFVQRCLDFCETGSGSASMVTQQTWLFLGSYRRLRQRLLREVTWGMVIRLGPRAFEAISGEVVNVALFTLTQRAPHAARDFAGLDASAEDTPMDKANALVTVAVVKASQSRQLQNPNESVMLDEFIANVPLLSTSCTAFAGSLTGDLSRFSRCFWEVLATDFATDWEFYQTAPVETTYYSAREMAILWEKERGEMYRFAQSVKHLNHVAQNWLRGKPNWGKLGVAISIMGDMHATLYYGEIYDCACVAIVPDNPSILPALWSFIESGAYALEVRKLSPSLAVSTATLLKVPFDIARWQEVAAVKYPYGLPKPHSGDLTQWLFSGHPKGSDQPLHVAVARLLGYRWPRQTGSSFLDCPVLGPDGLEGFADEDGLVCLPPLNREQPAAERLRRLLFEALGAFDEGALITSAGIKGSKSKTLEDWLCDEFFAQHAKLFRDRPFIWHLWDGRSDGFHVLANYHKLDHANLQKLTYSYLGSWIQQQSDDARADKPGAADRLGAARVLQAKLTAILEGEAPLDIFVRWKPIKDQARGWHPDINDGVRQNIRPFLLAGDVGRRGAGLFRAVPVALKGKDRGTEPERPKGDYPWYWCEAEPGTDPVGGREFVGSRWNDCHLTLGHKREANI